MILPKQYAWLHDEPGPRILREFVAIYGTAEKPGPGSNPSILAWAKAVGLERVYRDDATAWCGLTMSYVALQAGWDASPNGNALWARNWLAWGVPSAVPMLGDVLVFSRGPSSGHVGVYVGEDTTALHVIAGNQGDAVTIKRIPRARLLGSRRCPWRVNQPGNIRRVLLSAAGIISTNEA